MRAAARTVWVRPACCDAVRHARANPALFANKRVRELGAGSGLHGAVLSRLSQPLASITRTDYRTSVLRLMVRNLVVNGVGVLPGWSNARARWLRGHACSQATISLVDQQTAGASAGAVSWAPAVWTRRANSTFPHHPPPTGTSSALYVVAHSGHAPQGARVWRWQFLAARRRRGGSEALPGDGQHTRVATRGQEATGQRGGWRASGQRGLLACALLRSLACPLRPHSRMRPRTLSISWANGPLVKEGERERRKEGRGRERDGVGGGGEREQRESVGATCHINKPPLLINHLPLSLPFSLLLFLSSQTLALHGSQAHKVTEEVRENRTERKPAREWLAFISASNVSSACGRTRCAAPSRARPCAQ